jgi:hypothetical protein
MKPKEIKFTITSGGTNKNTRLKMKNGLILSLLNTTNIKGNIRCYGTRRLLSDGCKFKCKMDWAIFSSERIGAKIIITPRGVGPTGFGLVRYRNAFCFGILYRKESRPKIILFTGDGD